MSIVKHTTGPWFIGGEERSQRCAPPVVIWAGATPEHAAVRCGSYMIAEIYKHSFEPGGASEAAGAQASANARLIAAAPELLAACKLAFELLGHAAYEVDREHANAFRDVDRALKAALAKAGES